MFNLTFDYLLILTLSSSMLAIVASTTLSYYKNHTYLRPNCSYARHVQQKCVESTNGSVSSFSPSPSFSPPRTLLVVKMPILLFRKGYTRIRTLLDVLEYRCYVSPRWSVFRMTAIVGQGELEGCRRMCDVACECFESSSPTGFDHLEIARLANGRDHLLFAHADMFLDLFAWHRLTTQYPDHVLTPFGGGCFGWVDVVFLPQRVHRAFRTLARHFDDLFYNVAMPTIAHELKIVGLATWSRVDCLGSCCLQVEWGSVRRGEVLCAHRVDLTDVKWEARNKQVEGQNVCVRAAAAAKLHGGE